MKYHYSFALLIFLSCQSPNGLKKKKDISKVEEVSLIKNFQIYTPEKNPFVDSLVNSIPELRDLKISIEDLTKLNPNGIESFLDETLIKCDNLLNLKNKSFISSPRQKSELKIFQIKMD